ncbi:hypothetical protein IV102_07905 [bacterium]|nr:hypothetical protein [bacterium]
MGKTALAKSVVQPFPDRSSLTMESPAPCEESCAWKSARAPLGLGNSLSPT